MSLRKRLILFNAAVVVMPILITIAASFAFILFYSKIYNADISYGNVKKLTQMQYELFQANGSILQEKPEKLMDKGYQQYLATRFDGINAEIVLVKDGDIAFATKELNKIDIERCIEVKDKSFFGNSVDINGITYIVKVAAVSFSKGEEGYAILLAPLGKETAISGKLLFFAAATFLISFIGVNTLLSFLLSNRIIKPIGRLQTAAGEISQGNLDQEIIEEGDDEIRKLCNSFEKMRLKLKESVHTQMKYDENRKMLVSSISHDLKTPITSIKGYVEGIMDGIANTPDKTQKYLNTIHSKALQVDGMIEDLLLYSKLDLNQIPFDFEDTDIVKYFYDCVQESEPELERFHIKVTFQNDIKECGNVLIDRERIKRVFGNIIDNARKYMNKPEGEIKIILRDTHTSIIIEIQDNGAGIKKENLPYIFDRFYRADSARSTTTGSGLGLAIARQIIEGHGGKIWVKSRENEGTSILISLRRQNNKG